MQIQFAIQYPGPPNTCSCGQDCGAVELGPGGSPTIQPGYTQLEHFYVRGLHGLEEAKLDPAKLDLGSLSGQFRIPRSSNSSE